MERTREDGETARQPAALSPPEPNHEKPNLDGGNGEGRQVVGGAAGRAQHGVQTNDDGSPPDQPVKQIKNKCKKLKTEGANWTGVQRAEAGKPRRTRRRKRAKRSSQNEDNQPTEAPKLSLKRNTIPILQHADTAKRARGSPGQAEREQPEVTQTDVATDEKEAQVSNDLALAIRPSSKLPVPEKSKAPEAAAQPTPTETTDMLTKVVGLETLYAVLSEEHLGLQMSVQEAWRVVSSERAKRKALELELEAERTASKDNPINLALAHRIEELQISEEHLKQENTELKEELELLEFRMLEMDSSTKRTVSRSSDTRCDVTDIDDVSDSGVMSLPTSDDEPMDFGLEGERDRDVKTRLMDMCKSTDSVSERICLQQGLALLRHYEARIEGLESTIAAMCHEATMARTLTNLRNDIAECPTSENRSSGGGGGRIIATVLPFTEPALERKEGEEKRKSPRELDCLQESGIFEESVELVSHSTQTDWTPGPPDAPGDLSQEIRKLTRIRERIEEQGGQKKLLGQPPGDYTPSIKEVIFYRERLEALESRLSVYESSGDAQVKHLSARLEKETLLRAQVRHLHERIEKLEEENARLEEERCELEEAENDTRLRCQKLELKLSALGEKKSALKAQLQQTTRTMSNLKSSLTEEEKKKAEAKSHASRLEALVRNYEQKNQELEEREMEVRYRLQMLENTMPALMMWNMWRVMCQMQGAPAGTSQPTLPADTPEEDIVVKLKGLENKLANEEFLLEESRQSEDLLKKKVRQLEKLLNKKEDSLMEVLEKEGSDLQHLEVFDKLNKMVKDRLEMDRRIKDLEHKEKLYQETLQQADSMFAEMEGGYTQQIQEKDEELKKKEEVLKERDMILKKYSAESVMTSQLQEKIDALEGEVSRLKNCLSKREQEREMLETEEQRLYKELQDCLEQLDNIKKNVEGPLRGELEAEKRRLRELDSTIKLKEKELEKKDEEHNKEVTKLTRQITRLSRDMLENEVTIGELKEEVQTLELAVAELRQSLSQEKEEKEEIRNRLESRLEDQSKVIEDLKTGIKENLSEKSLKEELEEDALLEEVDSWEKMIFKNPPVSVFHYLENLEDEPRRILAEKQDYPKLMKRPPPPPPSGDCPQEERRPTDGESKKEVLGFGRKVSVELRQIEDSEPRVDPYSTSGDSDLNHRPLAPLLTPGCRVAQEALSSVNGRDLQGTVTWDPCCNSAGYKIRPTVSALELTIETLEEKCRVKDHLIESMAEELKYLSRTVNWDDKDLLETIKGIPNPSVDFNRQALACFLASEAKHSLETEAERHGDALPETNPLGLNVIRQVGPDSLLIRWDPLPPSEIASYEVFINGLFAQRIRNPGRTKTLLHPVNLKEKIYLTINAVTPCGDTCGAATITYPRS